MHYYINPWYFYLINVCESIKIVAFVYCIVSFLMFIIGGSIFFAQIEFYNFYDRDIEEISKKYGKIIKKYIASLIFSLVLIMFVPSEEVCTKMLISSFVTEENVETAQETIKNTVDYVMDRIEGKDAEDE